MAGKDHDHIPISDDPSCYRKDPVLESRRIPATREEDDGHLDWTVACRKKDTSQEIFKRCNERGWELEWRMRERSEKTICSFRAI